MPNFSNLKLRTRILLGYGVPLLLTIGATSAVIINAQEVEEQGIATERGWLLVRDTDRLELKLHKRQSLIRAYLLTGEERFLQRYEKSVSEYNQYIKSLEKLVQFSTPQQAQRLEQLKILGEKIYQTNLTLARLVKAGNSKAAAKLFSVGQILPLIDKATKILQDLNITEDKLQEQRENKRANAMRSLMLAAIVGTLAAIIMAIIIGSWLASRITKQVNEIANNIASSSREIAVTVEQQERTAIRQSSSVNETTTTMDQLNVSAQQSAQQAQSAATGAQQVLLLAGEGNQAVNRTLENMLMLTTRMNTLAEQISVLNEQTNQIRSISGLVADLANQTNMLALNAAVEAVRAGEHGKGFGVVASEIRKLADQSKKSAEKINMLVNAVQSSLNSTIMVTDESTKATFQGTKITEQTAEVFNQVTKAINDVAGSVQQISLNAQQQAMAVQQVVSAMNILNIAARDNASGISQTKVSTHQLNEAAQNLKAVV
ncbi:CHASE3 domain-containing protein [Phormidium sp. LEGE 05292]|uniref:methyl-accepting chemotaxis protein n=1 Tax=[Phormidium] sp. LEGE 05292 TaxID=767427 RepID=UPI00187E5504|nr:methyl-accepting chemotaxis protein [Phormidium sp. LEGE 05292]MBE9227759.1 CHASE3 domain-containing protein [Phormidium sp. LEGE 05292]